MNHTFVMTAFVTYKKITHFKVAKVIFYYYSL